MFRPVSAAGVYAPGGTASYPSSVLMNLLPAYVAGVKRRVLVSPCPQNHIAPAVAKAAQLGKCTEFLSIGGVQAVATLAFGLDGEQSSGDMAPVDIVVGPGNKWVAEAKRQVYGVVGIDSLAGPSEIAILADHTASPNLIAKDMCAQAEHDVDARAILVTTDRAIAEQVQEQLTQIVPTYPRSEIIASALANNSAVLLCDTLEQCIDVCNHLAA